ncbi:O-antigen ligase family protein [Paludibaculum fermentans]|uniref:O-antigen ligase family protein n=1 Tax=Paludibaculum fermentans TaxID=1473598 RepID=UPI003EBC8EC4
MNALIEQRERNPLVPLVLGTCAAGIAFLPSPVYQAAAAGALLAVPCLWFVLLEPDRWLSLFFAACLLAPPLPVALGNSGPHVALGIACIGLVVGVLRAGEWRLRLDAVATRLAILFAVLVGSVAFALVYSGAAVAAGSLARVCLFGIGCYVFFYAGLGPAQRQRRLATQLFWCAAGSALFACLDFYFQWPAPAGYGPQFIWLDSGVFRRAQGVFYEASTLGNLCVFFLTMSAVALMRPRSESPVPRWAVVSAAPVLATALVLSYSRASLVTLCICVGTLFFLQKKGLSVRRWGLIAAVSMLAGGALAFVLFPGFVRGYFDRILLSAKFLFSATNGVLSGRLDSWQRLATFLIEHPWHLMFGVGYKTLPYSDVAGGPVIADNMYLSLLVETGGVGLFAFLALNAAILRAGWRARSTFYGAWIFSFWTGQTIQMLSGDLLTYWRVIPVYFWVLAQTIRTEHE